MKKYNSHISCYKNKGSVSGNRPFDIFYSLFFDNSTMASFVPECFITLIYPAASGRGGKIFVVDQTGLIFHKNLG
ncbi:MAG: hypothetical protein DRH93_11165 [Deltaproteobacteria bacterium]|nr:MAG: hypothetical protein DRH93_11165 [Deltaproteobacteria bacterium]